MPSISESFGPRACLGATTFVFSLFDRLDCTTTPITIATTTTPMTTHHCHAPRRVGGAPRGTRWRCARSRTLRRAGSRLGTATSLGRSHQVDILLSSESGESGPRATSTARPRSTRSRTISWAYRAASTPFVAPPPPKQPQSIERPRDPGRTDHRDERQKQYRRDPRRRPAGQADDSSTASASSTKGSPHAIGFTSASGNSS